MDGTDVVAPWGERVGGAGRNRVVVRTRDAAGGWSATQRLPRPGGLVGLAAGGGRVAVAWLQTPARPGAGGRLVLATG